MEPRPYYISIEHIKSANKILKSAYFIEIIINNRLTNLKMYYNYNLDDAIIWSIRNHKVYTKKRESTYTITWWQMVKSIGFFR